MPPGALRSWGLSPRLGLRGNADQRGPRCGQHVDKLKAHDPCHQSPYSRFLEERRFLERDAENNYLALEPAEEDAIAGHSTTYRIAVGSQQSRRIFPLQPLLLLLTVCKGSRPLPSAELDRPLSKKVAAEAQRNSSGGSGGRVPSTDIRLGH